MSDQTKIGDLPPEMLCEVLQCLCLADLIRCKQVCKDWNSLLSTGLRLTSLVVDRKRNHRIRWHYDQRPVIASELCEPNLFLAQLKRPMLRGLKSLKVNCLIDEFEPNDLNALTNLLRLEINHELTSDLNLKLPVLEFLSLDIYTCDFDISIDCPNLKSFHCEGEEFFNVKIKHPESIVEAKINNEVDSDSQLAQFKNLERLITNDHQAFEDILKQLQRLRLIRFDCEVEHLLTDSTTNLTDQMKELLRDFLRIKKSLRRDDLQVYFAGLQVSEATIEKIDLNENLDELHISNEHFYMKNYQHLQERISFVTRVNYTRLMSLVDEVPKDYFDRFHEIYNVTVEGTIKDENHLLGFLRSLDDFDHLQLKNVNNLSQAFVERLPEFCPQLWNFELVDNQGLELDFDFIRRFKKLKLITLQLELSVRAAKSIINVFKDSSCLQDYFSFRCKGVFHRFESQKQNDGSPDGLFKLYVGSELAKENCSLDDVISYLEER